MAHDRLTAAAVLGGLSQRAWSLLLICAFLVPAAAASAAPMFAEASANAAFEARRDEVPATARLTDAAVVRLSPGGGERSLDQQSVLTDLRAVPGLTEPDLTGGSIGAEITDRFWGSTVSLGARRERGRLFAVGDPAADLVPVGEPAGRDGVWLPEPVATALAARPGDRIELAVVQGARGEPRRATATVNGIYAVDAEGRLPADPAGQRRWAVRKGDTPLDTEYETLPAYLVVGDVATVERLARAVDDRIFWAVEAELAPGVTLAEARRTADGVEALRREYATAAPAEGDDPLALRFASGIGRIVDSAQATAETVRQRTRPVEGAAIGIGLASVLAVALLSVRRRERELRHTIAVGVSPLRVGLLWLLEHLLPAALGAALGWLLAWRLVLLAGPPGAVEESRGPAALWATAAVAAGLLTVAAVSAVAATRRVRPAPPAAARRALPWGAMVVVVALVATAGLVGAGEDRGGARGVDLLVPLLVLAAAGVVAGWLPGRLAHRRGGGTPGVLWLVRRRLGGGGTERRLTVLVLTAGLGMLLFALSAVGSTTGAADDRVAVSAGAEAVAVIPGSWVLDDRPVAAPRFDPSRPPPEGPVPGVRNPPVPPGATVVWRTEAETPLDDGRRELFAVDPAGFDDVALWGRGPDLAAARKALAALAAEPVDPDGTVRTIVVADPAVTAVDSVRVTAGYSTRDLTVAARVPAFPGMGDKPLYVVAADPMFKGFGVDDPRLVPGGPRSPLFVQTSLWSAGGAAGVQAVVAPRNVVPERVDTAAQVRNQAVYVATSRARGYSLAVAGYLALLAILTLCLYAQRTAAQRRPADLMLARVGLGRARVGRARALELALLVAISSGAAVAGVAALVPLGGRLLDDQPGLLPRYAFQLSPLGVAVTAGVAVVATAAAMALSTARARTEEGAYRDD